MDLSISLQDFGGWGGKVKRKRDGRKTRKSEEYGKHGGQIQGRFAGAVASLTINMVANPGEPCNSCF